MTKTCEQCGETFLRQPNVPLAKWQGRRFCSSDCYNAFRHVPRNSKPCERCGKDFSRPLSVAVHQWADRQFCSRRCYFLAGPIPPPAHTYELAWAAGLYEGEGTTGVYKNGTAHIVALQIEMTDLQPLERFQAAVGFGTVKGPRHRGDRNCKPAYCWKVSKRAEIVAFFEAVWPYLSARRKDQARPVIAHCQQRMMYRFPEVSESVLALDGVRVANVAGWHPRDNELAVLVNGSEQLVSFPCPEKR